MDFGVAELLRGDAKVIVESLVLSWRNKPVDLQVDQPVKMMHHLKIFFFLRCKGTFQNTPDNIGWKMTWLKPDDLTRYVFD